MVDDIRIKARKQEEFQFCMAEFRKTMTALNNQQAALQEAPMKELRLLRLARIPPNSTMNIPDPDLLGTTKSTPTVWSSQRERSRLFFTVKDWASKLRVLRNPRLLWVFAKTRCKPP
ncbi:hypothetical protein ACFX15_045379 [Malus domestica]